MRLATHASLVLARFDVPREIGPVTAANEALFLKAAADVRAAKSNSRDLHAFKFALYGLHASEESAKQAVENRLEVSPWIAEASEVWAGVLLPFRHFGDANFLNPQSPGAVFRVSSPVPSDETPIVIVTSVGWDRFDGEAMERIQRFGEGVAAVRMGMTGLSGLRSQQSFTFPGGLETDGLTVTFWQDLVSAMAFAYGPGLHRMEVKTQREGPYGDRTSFTRFQIMESHGTWHGHDPSR